MTKSKVQMKSKGQITKLLRILNTLTLLEFEIHLAFEL